MRAAPHRRPAVGETRSLDTARTSGNAMRRSARQLTDPLTNETLQTALLACLAVVAIGIMAALRVHQPRRLAASPRRRMPWGVGVLIATVAIFLLTSAAFGGLAISLGLAPTEGEDMPPTRLLWVTLLGQAFMHLPLAVLLIALASRERRGLRRIGLLDRRWLRHALIGLGGLALVLPVIFGASVVATSLAKALGHDPSEIAHALLEAMFTAPPAVRVGFMISAVVVAPVLEELIFRGLLQTTLLSLARPMSPAAQRPFAILATTVVFLLLHLSAASPHALPALAVLSIGLGYLYERTGSLVTPIVAHAAFNAINIGLASLIVSSPSG